MQPSNAMVVEAAYASWSARDLEATLSCFSHDVMFAIHLPPEVAPYFGMQRGRDELGVRLTMILNEFDFLEYKPIQITSQGISFHSQIRFHYRHKLTGLEYDGTMRHVWRVKGDRIVRWEEFHDIERVRVYFQLLGQAIALQQVAHPAGTRPSDRADLDT
jgi:ketosteroid isomerase-like protein